MTRRTYIRGRQQGGMSQDEFVRAAGNGNVAKVMEAIAEGIDINKLSSSPAGSTALYEASIRGHLLVVEKLLGNPGIDVNKSSEFGGTPLFAATLKKHVSTVEKLLAAPGIDVNKANAWGATPLHTASDAGSLHIVEMLLAVPGIDVNKEDNFVGSPLYVSSMNGHVGIVETLLAAPGINVNKANNYGETPLHAASKMGHVDIVEKLLSAGADITAMNNNGNLPIDVAKSEEIKELINGGTIIPDVIIPSTKLWTKFTRADIAFTNDIFHQVVDAVSLTTQKHDQSLFSLCPVCLKYIEHDTGSCMYMSHSCKESAGIDGYYHKKLWKAFSEKKPIYDQFGLIINHTHTISWCTLCGRICKGHSHYKLSNIYSASGTVIKPDVIESGLFFATDCSKQGIGGGGIREKLNRYRQFRESVLFYNKPEFTGIELYNTIMDKIVEATWEAPLVPRANVLTMIQHAQKFNNAVGNIAFPLPPKQKNTTYENVAYPNMANPDLLPLVYHVATDVMRNATEDLSGDTENIVQFRHRQADGTINNHDGPHQQIALDGLMNYIGTMLSNQSSASFGLCWLQSADIRSMMPEGALTCTAKLYPYELLHVLEQAQLDTATKENHMNIYKSYRIAFNKKFGKPFESEEGLEESKNMEGGKRKIRKTRKAGNHTKHKEQKEQKEQHNQTRRY